MTPYSLKSLTSTSYQALHAAFLVAFDGYYIPMACPEQILRDIFAKNGVDLGVSVGVFDSADKLVGFTCVAVDTIHNHVVAYNNTTGVVPEWRRKGLCT